MASPTRFSVTRRNLRPARSLPSKSEPFAALPSVKKYPELKGAILTHASDNINGEGEKENDDQDNDEEVDERGARPTLGIMDALAFQQSILGKQIEW